MTFDHRDNAVDYLEFAVSDMSATKAFYAAAFGWTFTDYGPAYCEFTDGRIKGGFAADTPVEPGGALVVLYHNDLDACATAVTAAGGRIVKPVFSFPGGGRFEFEDPNGHRLAVWRQDESA